MFQVMSLGSNFFSSLFARCSISDDCDGTNGANVDSVPTFVTVDGGEPIPKCIEGCVEDKVIN